MLAARLLCADRLVQANTTEAEVQSAFHLLNADGSGRVNLTQWQEFYLQVTWHATRCAAWSAAFACCGSHRCQADQTPEYVDGEHVTEYAFPFPALFCVGC